MVLPSGSLSCSAVFSIAGMETRLSSVNIPSEFLERKATVSLAKQDKDCKQKKVLVLHVINFVCLF